MEQQYSKDLVFQGLFHDWFHKSIKIRCIVAMYKYTMILAKDRLGEDYTLLDFL